MSPVKIITSLVFFVFLSFSVKDVHAQISQESVGLLFSPPLIELVLDRGETYTQNVRLDNRSGDTQTYYPFAMDFVPRGEDGGQEFLSPSESDASFSLAQWIRLDTTPLTLRSGEKEVVSFSITVPQDAEPGGRYAAVFFGTQPTVEIDEVIGARIATQTGPVVLIRVAGDVNESARIVEFNSDSTFYEYTPVNLAVRVENMGNVHVKPVGEVTIEDIFGRIVANIPVNEKQGNVLPQSIRKFEIAWENDNFTIGRFTATVGLTYGSDRQQTVAEQIVFWVVPWKVIAVIILVLIIISLLLKMGIRRYNESIVRRAIENKENSVNPVPEANSSVQQ